jgi:Rgg/GadR/MutR family transcriptional activator
MSKKISHTLREIRVKKGLRQSEIASGIISTSFYARVERGENNISVSHFIELLDKLNVSFEEFRFIYNDYQLSEKEIVVNEITVNYYNKNFIRLFEIEKQCKDRYHVTLDIQLQHLGILAHCSANNFKFEKISPKIVDPIKEYLFKQQSWCRYELTLFANFMGLLNLDSVLLLADKVIKNVDRYWSFQFNDGEPLIILLLNLIRYCFIHDIDNKAQQFINIASNRLEGKNCLYERNCLHFLKGILLIRKKKIEEGKILCLQSIDIFKTLELYGVAKDHKKMLEKYSSNLNY